MEGHYLTEHDMRKQLSQEEKQNIGIGYVLTVDGKQYPVMACFPARTDDGFVKNKFEYLINGQKS